jgi:hypothetical protein
MLGQDLLESNYNKTRTQNLDVVGKTTCCLLVIERRLNLNSDFVRTSGAKICPGGSQSFRGLTHVSHLHIFYMQICCREPQQRRTGRITL